MRIVLSGMVAGNPHQGGASWAVLQYLLGLRALGHEVMLVEPVPELDETIAGYFTREIVERFSLQDSAALLVGGSRHTVGVPYATILGFARSADVVINISGMLRDPDLRDGALQVYLDLDPAFNQLWHEVEHVDAGLDGHDRYVTVGLAVGTSRCGVPTCGKRWITTLPPVVLDHWPVAGSLVHHALTTVGNWRAYGSISHDGVHYGQRAHSVRELIELPERLETPVLVALAIDPGEAPDLERLERFGWKLIDPRLVAGTPDAYASFLAGSMAELAIAKRGYVVSRAGWFSDRSACYLASGRPVVAQETGFSSFLPVGDGLFSFDDVDSAVAAVEAVCSDYERQRRAARELAEELLDSRKVLARLLEELAAAR